MKRVGAIVLCFASVVTLQAQQMGRGQMQPPGPQEEQQFFFYQAVNLVGRDSTLSRVDVPYRIDSGFFIAVRNDDPSLPFPFKRRGEILVELLDKDGVSKAREISRFEAGAATTEVNPDRKNWSEGMASFSVPPGEYTIVFEINDLESERHFLDRNKTVKAGSFRGSLLENSTPLFVREEGDSLALVNFGGNIEFGKGASIFLQLHADTLSPGPVRVEYAITTRNFLYEDPKVILTDTIPALAPLTHAWPTLMKADESGQNYFLTADAGAHTSGFIIPLKAEMLPLRPYTLDLTVKRGNAELSISRPFRMVWPEMPSSLRDVDFALEALRHITTEDELDSLKSGSREARVRHLEEFWKPKDRTPGTEYNEVMVEYYRRVDYAQRNFSSIRGGDGYKTDRGRIYILYGPPTTTERSLDPSAGYQEVWTYEKQGKKFIFRDQSKSGNYTLVATQNL